MTEFSTDYYHGVPTQLPVASLAVGQEPSNDHPLFEDRQGDRHRVSTRASVWLAKPHLVAKSGLGGSSELIFRATFQHKPKTEGRDKRLRLKLAPSFYPLQNTGSDKGPFFGGNPPKKVG